MAKFTSKKFSENLSRLMKDADISLTDLSKHTDIPIQTIQRYRSDPKANPTISLLKPIAEYFNITIDELISGKPSSSGIELSHIKENKLSKVPLLSWKEAIDWKSAIKEKNPSILTEVEISQNSYALKIEEDLDDGFRKNSIIIIDPDLEAEDKDYLVSFKKDSKIPLLKQLRKYDGILYLKPLMTGIAPAPLTDDYFILGVVRQIKLTF